LRVLYSEHCICVRFSIDVRDAPVVPDDRDTLGLLLPASDLGGFGGIQSGRGSYDRESKNELL